MAGGQLGFAPSPISSHSEKIFPLQVNPRLLRKISAQKLSFGTARPNRIINPNLVNVKLKRTAYVLIAAVVFATCKYELPFSDGSGGDAGLDRGGACHPDTVYFFNTILPLISSGCASSGCHDADSREAGLALHNYSGIRSIVAPGKPAQSLLYEVITTKDQGRIMPPPPHTPFDAAATANIHTWISQGAQNNYCSSSCDSTAFSWSKTIRPIIETFCKGCHNAGDPGGGIDLSTYAGVRAAAASGELARSIRHDPGAEPMPEAGRKLEECQIKQIEQWIAAGMPAN
jgi:hypothetical protein